MTRLTRLEPPRLTRERTHYLVRGTIAPVFIAAHAVAASDAMPFVPSGKRETRAFASMLSNGSIRKAAHDRFWFDMTAYEAAAARRSRQLAPLWIAAATIGAIIATMFYRG